MNEFLDYVDDAIRLDIRNATLVPLLNHNKIYSLAEVHAVLLGRGWAYNETLKQFEREGWYLFLRSQGELAPPIAQWQPLGRDSTGMMFDDMELGPELEDVPASPQLTLF
jgi:hypothetical protein